MRTSLCLTLYIWTLWLVSLVHSTPWRDSGQFLEDMHDLATYRAVVKSMNQWELKQVFRRSANRTKRDEPSVCYKDLGCFDASGPFGYLDMLPSRPEEINTRFLMYPARNRQRRSGSAPTEVPFEKLDDAFEWAKSGFNQSLPTKVLIHGFGSDCGYIWAYEIRSALMAVEEVNAICVDWSNGAALPNYVKASANTRLVGKQLSLLLSGLVEKNGLSLMNTHLIGFSLGAHIAGFAGADLGNLSRITGLDPAGPLFESQDTRARLDQTDASFVDVIHSNGENLILGGLGSSQPMGHVDFYPNGGRMQKGCSHLFVGAVSDIIWSSAVEGRSLCNHRRAYKFFIDSVSPRCHFPAFPCDSYENFVAGKCFPCTEERKCGNMGYYADRSKGRGQLYLITRDEEPFCAHQYLVRIETPTGGPPVKNYGKIQVTLIGESFLNETFTLTRKDDEEMNMGDILSRIMVLHPILSQPTKIEIQYTAYSGWLSSGLTKWKIDKVMLMDSFGKIVSFCKKGSILESGVPMTLPLYPRDCDIEDDNQDVDAEVQIEPAENSHPGYDIGLKEVVPEDDQNFLEPETESSRAFNSIITKADKINRKEEVVEPILKPHATKNGRAHVPNSEKNKSEITEPVLGPTTVKTKSEGEDKWNWQDDPRMTIRSQTPVPPASNPNPLDAIVTTVQFLPQRLARMFEQAEKYARETILPLVSTYTPRFISDFIGPRDEPRYVPLHFEDEKSELQEVSSSEKRSISVESVNTHIQRIAKKGTSSTKNDTAYNDNPTIPPSTTSTTVATSNSFNFTIDYGMTEVTSQKSTSEIEDVQLMEEPAGNRTFLNFLAETIQSLPDSWSRMVGQLRNFTRSTLMPLVRPDTPMTLGDLLWIRPRNTTVEVNHTKTVDGEHHGVVITISEDTIQATTQNSDIYIEEIITSTNTPLYTTTPTRPNHIQKIPKKGEKLNLKIPHPFSIFIDPKDLTTTSTSTTTTPAPRPTTRIYQSYIQKVSPRKPVADKKPHVIIKHVVDEYGHDLSYINQYGNIMSFKVGRDGRIIV